MELAESTQYVSNREQATNKKRAAQNRSSPSTDQPNLPVM